jgi:hypothetical protein
VYPKYRVRLYQAPIASIRSIRIRAGNVSPLVDREVVITDPGTIQKIMAAIRSAKKYSPNHPATRWSCSLTIAGASGESYVDVNETLGQGAILYGETAAGFIFDTLQSSDMSQILEEATTKRRS